MQYIKFNLKLTSLFYLPEKACPVAAGSGSLELGGFPLVGRRAFLSSRSAPSLPPLHPLSPASLFPQDYEGFNDTMQNNILLCKESTCLFSLKADSESCQYGFLYLDKLITVDQICGYVHFKDTCESLYKGCKYLCVTDRTFLFFDSLLFFFECLLFCLLCLRCLGLSSISLSDSTAEET